MPSIPEGDIRRVREASDLVAIVGDRVQLRQRGRDFWGCCPFHNEKTPSFKVDPTTQLWHCFGCGEGGDVISFVMKIDDLGFADAGRFLAQRAGIQIAEDPKAAAFRGKKARLKEACEAAAEFYHLQLMRSREDGAASARAYLASRDMGGSVPNRWNLGYAPGRQSLVRHLSAKGFASKELIDANLALVSKKDGRLRDRFYERVMFPIRDADGDTIAFGGRVIGKGEPKYLNTQETPLFHKSRVLFGLDVAKAAMASTGIAVIVEGYTDVMAAHLSGVDTAVASCGTAFGDDHARMLQRLLGTHDGLHGEVVFTFDGDAAGQKAALKVFQGDHNFMVQTYVAVEPSGLDPCELWQRDGEAAVRELVGRRIPLYRFVMSNVLKGYDLERADGRLGALREAAGLLSAIRDRSLVNQYLRELADMLGMDLEDVRREVANRSRRAPGGSAERDSNPRSGRTDADWPDPDDPALRLERDTLKLMLQYPFTFDQAWNSVRPEQFTHPGYAAVFRVISATEPGDGWTEELRRRCPNELVLQLLVMLLVEPLLRQADENYSLAHTNRLQLADLSRRITGLKSRLQRTDPVKEPEPHKAMFEELTGLELRRKRLLEQNLS